MSTKKKKKHYKGQYLTLKAACMAAREANHLHRWTIVPVYQENDGSFSIETEHDHTATLVCGVDRAGLRCHLVKYRDPWGKKRERWEPLKQWLS